MRQEFTASLAIKSSNGMGFGTAYWMQGDRVAFTTEMEIEKGDRIEIRMELTGFNDSAMGQVLVIQTRQENSGLLTCLGQIMEMPEDDFEMLNQWLEDLISGNTASQSSRWLKQMTGSRGPQASQDETAAALRRMDKRMGLDSKAPMTPSASPEARSGPDSTTRKRVGRQAIRAALRASVRAGSAPAAEPPASPTKTTAPPTKEPSSSSQQVPLQEATTPPAEPSTPAPVATPAAPEPQAQPTASSTSPQTTTVDNTLQVGIRVERAEDGAVHLSWANTQSLIHTWKQGLKSGKLSLPPFENAPEAGEQCRFDLTLPGGETFALRGKVSQSDASGLLCDIRIPWGTRIKLLRIQEKT